MKYVALEDVAKIDRTVASDDECATLPYVGLEHIEKDVGYFVAGYERQPETLLATKFRFTPKHVLYSKLRPYLNKVALPSFDGVCTTEVLPILPDEKKLDRVYLWAYLLSPKFVAWASNNVSGANLPRLDPKLLAEFEIPLPPLLEQQGIAARLDKAERLRRLRRYALDLGETYLQSVFLEMFGDPVRNEREWDIVEIGDLDLFISDGNYSERYPSQEEFVASGIPFIRANNLKERTVIWDDMRYITPEKHQELQKGHIKTDDLLVTTRGSIGLSGLVSPDFEDANINAQLVLLRVIDKQIDPRFLLWVFQFPSMLTQLANLQTGTALQQLPVGNLKKVLIPLPPLALQEKFAGVVRQYDRLRARQRESLRQAEMLFGALLEESFRPHP